MAFQVVKLGGAIEPVEGSAKAFGEVHLEGDLPADVDSLKATVMMCIGMAWGSGDYTAAGVAADPSKLINAIENSLIVQLIGATGKVVSITIIGGAEPAAPTDTVALAGDIELSEGRKAKLFGSAMVGGVTDLDKAKRYIFDSAAMLAGMGETMTDDNAYLKVGKMAQLGLRDDG